MFELQPDSDPEALSLMNAEHPTRTVVGHDEQRSVVKSRPHPETPGFFHTKTEVVFLWQAQFGFTIVVLLT